MSLGRETRKNRHPAATAAKTTAPTITVRLARFFSPGPEARLFIIMSGRRTELLAYAEAASAFFCLFLCYDGLVGGAWILKNPF